MGLQVQFQSRIVEFNTALALYSQRFEGEKSPEEIVPSESIVVGQPLSFLKSGYRIYLLHQLIPLVVTEGKGSFIRVLGLIEILDTSHFHRNGDAKTSGAYVFRYVFDQLESDRWLTILSQRGNPQISIG
jgi:hypothetical protein